MPVHRGTSSTGGSDESANTALRFVCALIAVAIPTFAMLALIVTVANPPPRVNVLLAFIAAGVVVYLGWAER
jgi:zinc transporter ZupT